MGLLSHRQPRPCEWCGTEFTPTAKRPQQRFCSSLCSRHHNLRRMNNNCWEPAADAWLEEHAGTMPPKWLHQKFCEAAQENGWHQRTHPAVRRRCATLGLHVIAVEDNLSINAVSNLLGVPHWTVVRWVRNGLYAPKVNRRRRAISLTSLRRFISRNPWEGKHVPEDALKWLMGAGWARLQENMKTAHRPKHSGLPRPVRCTDPETGTVTVYSTTRGAARANYIEHGSISHACDNTGWCCGKFWEWID